MNLLSFLFIAALVLANLCTVYGNDDDHHHDDDEHHAADHASEDSAKDHTPDGGEVEADTYDHDDEEHDYTDPKLDDDDDSDDAWHRFEEKYDDHYEDPAENERHKQEWKKSKHYIKHEFPEQAKKEGWNFKVGMTELADQSDEDIKEHFKGLMHVTPHGDPLPKPSRHKRQADQEGWVTDIPDEFDWRDYKAVTKVKKQMPLGSCWAFATAATLETQYFLKWKKLIDVSVEPLLTCCKDCYDGTENMPLSGRHNGYYKKLTNRKKIGSDAAYAYPFAYQYGTFQNTQELPYIAKETGPVSKACKQPVPEENISTKTYYQVTNGNEQDLMEAIYNIGPGVINLPAESKTFKQFKAGGLFTDRSHCSEPIDHAMAVVGYGTVRGGKEHGQKYFVIKNSWGENWGEKGYMRYKRGLCSPDENGIAKEALFPKFPVNQKKFVCQGCRFKTAR